MEVRTIVKFVKNRDLEYGEALVKVLFHHVQVHHSLCKDLPFPTTNPHFHHFSIKKKIKLVDESLKKGGYVEEYGRE